ncbi:MAG TPA: DUF3019 domain-containing protein [Cellvibrio sp.]
MEGYTISDGVVLNRFSATSFAAGLFLAAQLPGSMALANEVAAAHEASLPLIQFSIKPRLCVLNAGEEVCRDELEVKWQSSAVRSLCLYQTDKAEPLRCWQNATRGEYQFELTASVSTDFELRETDTGTAVSDQRFQVVYNDKKYRRARRNPWSFF